ncbi:MAG TPA: hypothetical protein VFK30_12060, partial [Anaerolineae bacterium]|nr:hypothetical protein [Anaerolineae bacterium]
MRVRSIVIISLSVGLLLGLIMWASTHIDTAHASGTTRISIISASCQTVSCTTFLPLIRKSPPVIPAEFEVTQAVQQPNNSVILVANRTTYVRFTLTTTNLTDNVSADLYGLDSNDLPLPGSPLAAINNPRTLTASANRAALGDTFNFKLPAAWTSGSIKLSARASNSAGYDVSTATEPFQFVSANPMHVTIIPIHYTCNNYANTAYTPAAPFGYLTNYTYRIYPVPAIITSTHSTTNYSGPCSSVGPVPSYQDWKNILSAITDNWSADGSPNNYYYGLITIDCGGFCIAGIGWIGGYKAAVGFTGFGAAHTDAGETHAHEVGHNHGRDHAPGCGTSGDLAYPYLNSSGDGIIGNSSHQNFGFDILAPQIHPYNTYYDIMNYCTPQWVSDYTYAGLYNFDNVILNSAQSRPLSNRSFLISGSIDPGSDQATIQSVYALDVPAALPPRGDHTLELLNAQGNIIAAYSFKPTLAHADRFPSGSSGVLTGFHLNIPYVDNVASIRIRRGSMILGQLGSGA